MRLATETITVFHYAYDRDWGCESCKREHGQFLQWLEELQERRLGQK